MASTEEIPKGGIEPSHGTQTTAQTSGKVRMKRVNEQDAGKVETLKDLPIDHS